MEKQMSFLPNDQTMQEIYVPDKSLSIDESMILWRGRLVFRQYIKNKKHKYGIKFFELCESNGMILRASIYTGTPYPDPHFLGQTVAIVLYLYRKCLNKSCCVYTDN